ncbi:MAG: class I SAM-dependent methyltransferase [Paraglaciecola sp.]|uniref:class I SAM-dependent methyltransferase n=1 Tax=Paraglaciecola sp. TaxID=1920173 RepID=UPI00329A6B31
MHSDLPSKDYVFSSDAKGQLIFQGNFEEYYCHENDPWDQSATGESSGYYKSSRDRLSKHIESRKPSKILEIGCGLGYACKHFSLRYPSRYFGWDISKVAIKKARKEFPEFTFDIYDITAPIIHTRQYDVVILNQLLWYILPQLDQVIENCANLLTSQGVLIISNAFARDQKFGNEYIDGFSGAFDYFNQLKHQFKLVHSEYNDEGYRNLDGLFICSKHVEK